MRRSSDRLFKLDYAVDEALRYLKQFETAGAEFFASDRFSIMYLNGEVTELGRVTDVLRAFEVHAQKKNLWCDQAIAANFGLHASKRAKKISGVIATKMDSHTCHLLPRSVKRMIKHAIENQSLGVE